MFDTSTAKQIIVTSVGCGNDDLRSFLESNIDALWCSVSEKCEEELKFYKVQLMAIDVALSFVRNEIDKSSSSSESVSSSSSSSVGYSDTQGQGTNQGTSCGYSTAVTLSTTRSDSLSQNQSETNATSHGESQSQSHSWDRGNGSSNGYSQAYNNVVGGGYGDSFNYNVTSIEIHIQAHSRENGPGPSFDLASGFPSFSISPPFITDPDLSAGYNDPGWQKPPHPDYSCGPINTLPNYGHWYSGVYNMEISTPLFDAGATWDVGADFDQVHIITNACDESSTKFITEGTNEALSTSDSIGNSTSRNEAQSQQDAHAISEGSSDSRSDSYSGSNSLTQGSNESHSESDSEGRSEAQSSSQATAWGKSHSESKSESSSVSKSESSSVMWSQIFTNLNELWKRTFEEVKNRDKSKTRSAFKMSHSRLPTVKFRTLQPCGSMPRQFTPLR